MESDVRTDPKSRRSKGFGFVTFVEPSSVDRCIAEKGEHVIDGRWVDVKRYGEADEPGRGREEDRHEDRYREESRRHYSEPHRAIAWFQQLAEEVNPAYMDLDYQINLSLPSSKCGALIGYGGEHVREVQKITRATVTVGKKETNEAPDAFRQITIVGPLLSVYAAHMLLMKHYNDDEVKYEEKVRPQEDRGDRGGRSEGSGGVNVEDLQRQLAELTRQVKEVKNRDPPSRRGSRGGRPGRH